MLVAGALVGLAAAALRGQHPMPAAPVAHGLDPSGMDPSVAPGDDFYRYANGTWEKQTDIPPDRSRWGISDILGEESSRRTKDLLEEAARSTTPVSSGQKKAGDYYASFMDEAGIEAKGATPLRPTLDRIAAIADPKGLARELGEQLRADVDPLNNTNFHTDRLFGLWVSPDLDDPSRNVPYLLQGGLDLPDREYYVSDSQRMADLRATYRAHIAATLRLAGVPDGDARAGRILGLEHMIARAHATRLESLDVLEANHPWKRTDFAARAPGLDWNAFFAAAGLDTQPVVVVWHPHAISGLSALAASQPLETWKDWLTFHAIDRMADVLPRAFVDERFSFHGKALTGTTEIGERWKRAVASTDAALGDEVGQLYVQRYFPPETKAQVQAMVKNIVAAFGRRIDRLDRMSAETKARANEKLSTLYVGVGYPETWIDYSSLDVVRGDAFWNRDRAERLAYRASLEKLGRAVEKGAWCMTPQTVNAVNLPLQNGLNFPAAILQPPFFDPAAPAAVNYGAIGSIIGHEISHSFDDQGAQFDARGRLANWWTKADLAHFEASGAQLAAQYDRYAPFPDLHVNGRQTLSESIADLAGLAASYDAWTMSLGGLPAPASLGLTGEQQFFLSFAQSWRSKTREAALRQQIITDGHAPDPYRAAIVRNLEAWYGAFDVKQGQALFLAPQDRVRIW